MKKSIPISIIVLLFMSNYSQAQDWANLNRYQQENTTLRTPNLDENRVVFMGNSITESWSNYHAEFFERKSYINRGISGQTTPQMLIRFRQDVIALKPKIVVILAGTNDIAENTGPTTIEMIIDNIISMAEIAKSNNIKVIISSVLPAYDYPWNTGLKPNEKIPVLNRLLKEYANKNSIVYLDYFTSMSNKKNGFKNVYTYDGVHPNKKGYLKMELLVEKAIKKTLLQK